MKMIKIAEKRPKLDEKIWFKEPEQKGEAFAQFLGMSLNEEPCFRSPTGRVILCHPNTIWKSNSLQPERSKREDPKGMRCSELYGNIETKVR